MEARTTASGDAVILELTKRKRGIFNKLSRFISFCTGCIGMIAACFLFVTIIGIIPGVGLFTISMGLVGIGLGYESATCPNCGKKQNVIQHAQNFMCFKCKKLTLIEWKK